MQKEPMTNSDYDKLTQNLNDMKLVQRPKILVAIEEARQLGDLKENAEYHAAKEDQANIDKKIAEVEDMITRAVIIDPSTLSHDKISFGSTVKLVDVDTDEEITYTIVSSLHSNPEIGNISFHSPLAKQLLGKSEGDEFTAKLPGGQREFEILEIFYDGSKIC
ncbi:MAG: transcription elongation factor GreA [Campylobacterales bacterium]|nr:transcription elongation factor GreA [Campylobacterales bacterium]